MASKKRKKLNAFGMSSVVRHVRLYHWLLDCPAWRALSPGASRLLIEVWKRHNGQNNGQISYSVREAAVALGCTRNTASKRFHELEDKGFLKTRRRGSFDCKVRHATTWEVTAERCDDKAASKDFMGWRPEEKQNPVSMRGTDGLTERHRRREKCLSNTHDGPTERDRDPQCAATDGLNESDTYSLPRVGASGTSTGPPCRSKPGQIPPRSAILDRSKSP